jgi:hypothetical protein
MKGTNMPLSNICCFSFLILNGWILSRQTSLGCNSHGNQIRCHMYNTQTQLSFLKQDDVNFLVCIRTYRS